MRRQLDVVTPRPQPLGWYVRVGYNDHEAVARFVENGGRPAGVVLMPEHEARHATVRGHIMNAGIETILEPHSLEQSFHEANARPGIQRLPWRTARPHTPKDLSGIRGVHYIRQLVDAIARFGYGAVISPSHYLAKGADDNWFRRDLLLASRLRRELDHRQLGDVRIYYRVAAPAALLREQPRHAHEIAEALAGMDIDAVWLLLHPFGDGASGVVSLRGYLQTARAFHRAGRPLIAERVGAVGLVLEALGAVGGSVSSLTYGEQVDASALSESSDGNGFSAVPRVYFSSLMAYLSRDDAKRLLDRPHLRALHVCGKRCCRNGTSDTLRDPALHYAVQREAETDQLSKTPSAQRPGFFMTEMLSPATRFLVQAATIEQKLQPALVRAVTWGIVVDAWTKSGSGTDYGLPALGERYRPSAIPRQRLRVMHGKTN